MLTVTVGLIVVIWTILISLICWFVYSSSERRSFTEADEQSDLNEQAKALKELS